MSRTFVTSFILRTRICTIPKFFKKRRYYLDALTYLKIQLNFAIDGIQRAAADWSIE